MRPARQRARLFDLFKANVCGRDLAHGKPDLEIFLLAASELGMAAARAGGMAALGSKRSILTTIRPVRCPWMWCWGGSARARSQVVKQADVVALLGLLPEEFTGNSGARNFRYYEPRCGHGSSLSRAMHGLVAARLGFTAMALRYFRETAAVDLGDAKVAADGGVPIAALGGVWMTAVFGFAGISLRSDGLAIDPRLPPLWKSLAFSLRWRGRTVAFRIDRGKSRIEATLSTGDPMTLFVRSVPHDLRDDRALSVSCSVASLEPME